MNYNSLKDYSGGDTGNKINDYGSGGAIGITENYESGDTVEHMTQDPPLNAATYDEAQVAVRLLICVTGLIGNMLVLFVIVVLQEYKKAVTNWYVLQLAIADSVFLLTLPFAVSETINNEWIYNVEMCKAKETILFINYYASILFLTIMSIDRYIAVCCGFSDSLQKFRSHRAAYIITLVTWILAVLLCIPVMLFSTKRGIHPNCHCEYEFPKPKRTAEEYCGEDEEYVGEELQNCISRHKNDENEPSCVDLSFDDYNFTFSGFDYYYDYDFETSDIISSNDTEVDYGSGSDIVTVSDACTYWGNGWFYKGYLVFNFVFMFIIPLVIMVFCYFRIITKINRTRTRTKSEPSNNSLLSHAQPSIVKKPRQRTKSAASAKANSNLSRVTIMCAVMVLMFVVCWLPFHSVHMAKIKGMELPKKYERWCLTLPVFASLIAYMNSALNPFIYNFLGTNFFKRFRNATSTMSCKIRSSISSNYKPTGKRKTTENSISSSNATGTTKVQQTTAV